MWEDLSGIYLSARMQRIHVDTDILNLLDADIILEREAKVADRKGSPGRVLSDCRLAPGCRIGA